MSSNETTVSTSSFISYPSSALEEKVEESLHASPALPSISKNRLYIGNLHSTVDEYTLIQLFSKHGKVSKLDFLFHKTGPAKGKPRGYAFVEYSSQDEALDAQSYLHDKLLRGRRLVVTFAHQAPQTEGFSHSKRSGTDTSRPTALSLLKTHNNPGGTEGKIAALEAKLRQMEEKTANADNTPSRMTILPSSLPSKPLVSTLPAVPAGGVQRKPGGSLSAQVPLYSNQESGDNNAFRKTASPLESAKSAQKGTSPVIANGQSSMSKLGPRHRTNPLGIVKKR